MARFVGASVSRKSTETTDAIAITAAARTASRADLKGQRYQVGSRIGVGLVDFLLERIQDIVIAAALQVIFQSLQRYADDVTVM